MQRLASVWTRAAAYPALLLLAVAATAASPAHASLPVPFVMVGCILDGRFVTESQLRTARLTSAPLRALEGKTIRVEGLLGPRHFQASAVHVVADTCTEALYASYFLCDPCQTTLSHPPSRLIPPREPGTRLDLPDPALRELDDLNSRLESR